MNIIRAIRKFFQPPVFQPPSQQILQQIQKEITTSIEAAYQNPNLTKLFQSANVKYLLDTVVQMFVGSRTCPRNLKAVEKLIACAKKKANKLQLLHIQYYEAYLKKLESIQKNNLQLYQQSQERLLQLSNLGHPTANHLIGTEMYKLAHQIIDKKKKRQKEHMIETALQLLGNAAQKGSYHSFYILGCMYQEGDVTAKKDYETAYNYFVLAASFDNPFALFKLAIYHQNGYSVQKNILLYLYYLKQAAEAGVTQAQYNLALQYLNGKLTTKNQMKALAWFIHAGAHGFVHAKYNAAMLYLHGTECGTLKPNLRAAISYLEQIQKTGHLDVSETLEKLIEYEEKSQKDPTTLKQLIKKFI